MVGIREKRGRVPFILRPSRESLGGNIAASTNYVTGPSDNPREVIPSNTNLYFHRIKV